MFIGNLLIAVVASITAIIVKVRGSSSARSMTISITVAIFTIVAISLSPMALTPITGLLVLTNALLLCVVCTASYPDVNVYGISMATVTTIVASIVAAIVNPAVLPAAIIVSASSFVLCN